MFFCIFFALILFSLFLRTVHTNLLASLSPDSWNFQVSARLLADRIGKEGWSAWEPAPGMQAPVGLAAAMMVFCHYSVIPNIILNCFLISAAAVLTGNIAVNLGLGYRGFSIAGAVFLMPSILMVASVLHKDPFVILGFACILYGFSLCVKFRENETKKMDIILALLLITTGSLLVWIVRNYAIIIILLGGVTFFAADFILNAIHYFRSKYSFQSKKYFLSMLLMVCAMLVLIMISRLPPLEGMADPNQYKLGTSQLGTSQLDSHSNCAIKLPQKIQERLDFLIKTRYAFIASDPNSGSMIDKDVALDGVCDTIAYIPRAVKIGFLAPFPRDWISSKRKWVIGVCLGSEMTLYYLGLVGFITLLYKHPLSLVPLLCFVMAIIVVLVIGIPNIGTLYRMRLPYILPIIGLGLAFLSTYLLPKKH